MASNVFVTPRSVSTIARGRVDTNSSLQALLQHFYSSAAPVDSSVNLEGTSALQNGMIWRQGGIGEPIGRILVYDTNSPSHPLYSGFTREGIAYVSQNTLSQANSALSNNAFQTGELVRIIDQDKLYMVNKLGTALIPFGSSDAANLWKTNNTYVYYTGGLNMGIGTNTPNSLLHISSGTSGDSIIILESDTDNNNEGDNPQIWFKQDGGITEGSIGLGQNHLEFVSNIADNSGFRWLTGNTSNLGTTSPYTGATEKMSLSTSGNLTVTGSVTASSFIGNASTATTLQTARTINGTAFDGSTNITTANWGTSRTLTIGDTGKSVNGSANVAWSRTELGITKTNIDALGIAASTADSLATARTIAISGDVAGSASFDGSANVTIAATIQPNSVALGTDTTGNYVADITQGSYIIKSGTAGEGWSPSIAVDATSTNTPSKVVARDASGNFSAGTITATLSGNASTADSLATARTISLGGVLSGSTTFDGSSNVTITASHTSDPVITLTGAVTGSGTMTNLGNVSITTTATADPTLTLAGDATGSATFTNLGNATLTVTVVDDSHNHIISNVDGLQTALDGKLSTSGKAADSNLLDGIDSASFLRSDTSDSFTGNITNSGSLLALTDSNTPSGKIKFGRNTTQYFDFHGDSTSNILTSVSPIANPKSSFRFAISTDGGTSLDSTYTLNGSSGTLWHSGNDGSGSGLDADTLDGIESASFLRSDADDSMSGRLTLKTVVTSQANTSTTLIVGANETLGDLAGDYIYPQEFQFRATTNTQRLQIAGYRRDASSTWHGTAYRLQYAVDNSFTDGTKAYIDLGTRTGGLGYLSLGTSGNDRLYIDSSGNVGIGTTSPATLLDVAGDVTIADKIIHSGDTNTSIRFPAADTVSIETAGLERLRVDSAGRLGIGTSSPLLSFQVAATTTSDTRVIGVTSNAYSSDFRSSQLKYSGVDATGTTMGIPNANLGSLIFLNTTNTLIGTNGSSPLIFSTLSTERMRIDSTGNIGIGTNNPTSKLDVNGDLRLFGTGPVILTLEADTDNAVESDNPRILFKQDGGVVNARLGYATNTNSVELINEFAENLFLGTSNAAQITITSGGNVGVGTTSPGTPLDVAGSIRSSSQLISTVATGTAPISVVSTTLVTNLNADLLDNEQLVDGDATGNTVVGRNPSGDIFARLLRTTYGNEATVSTAAAVHMRVNNNTDNYSRAITGAGFVAWLTNYDGSGSGLDADFLDGLHAANFIRSDAIDSIDGALTVNTGSINAYQDSSLPGEKIRFGRDSNQYFTFHGDSTSNILTSVSPVANPKPIIRFAYSLDGGASLGAVFTLNGSSGTIWHSGNDGAGSGLDSDLLDGQQGSYYQDASNLNTGTIPDARISGSYTGMTNLTGSGTVDFAKFLGNAADSATAPSFSWTGDTNTGMYQPAADQIGFATGGTNRVTIGSTGNVGIGTSIPRSGVHIYGAGQQTANITDAGNQNAFLRVSESSTSGGSGGGVIFASLQSDDTGAVGFAAIKGLLTNGSGNTTGDLAFSTRALVTDTALTERMRLTAAGNLGIGTVSPSQKLHVVGQGLFSDHVTLDSTVGNVLTLRTSVANTNDSEMFFEKSRSGGQVVANDRLGTIRFRGHNGTAFADAARIEVIARSTTGDFGGELVLSSGGDKVFLTGETERMRLTSTGNLLVGTSVILAGAENTNTGFAVEQDGSLFHATGGQFTGFYISKIGTPTTPSTLINFSYNGVSRGSITTNGTNVAYNTTSDYRLKTNVQPLNDSIDVLMRIAPKTFTFIGDPDETVTPGFIAHELDEAVPSAVTGKKDEVDESGAPRYQSVDNSKLVPILTAALQEAIKRIEQLEHRIETLMK